MFEPGYIFDLAGTLVDSYPEIIEAFEGAVRKVGEPIPERVLMIPLIGTSMTRVVMTLFPHWTDADRTTFRHAFWSLYDKICHRSQPFEGAGQLLDRLAGRYVIVSNKPQVWADKLVTTLGWEPIALICPNETRKRKPSADMLFEGVELLRHRGAHQRIMTVGDSDTDRLAAERAGLPFYQVAWSTHRTSCDGVITSWMQFLDTVGPKVGG